MKNIIERMSKRTIAILTAAVIIISCCSVQAYAAGTEDWGAAQKTKVGTMNVYNQNTTPVKTITRTGTLNLWYLYTKGDSYDGDVMVKITVYVNGVKKSYYEHTHAGSEELIPTCQVSAGDKVQILTDVCTITGSSSHYRSAKITYSYAIK
jgi:PBP1b-binding outer membrane lipoprotein LpoB